MIKIKSVGHFNNTFLYNRLKKKLDNEFIIKFDDPNPDYLIYSVYNNEDINPNYTKSNPIRIADYHLENIFPDLNYADYKSNKGKSHKRTN